MPINMLTHKQLRWTMQWWLWLLEIHKHHEQGDTVIHFTASVLIDCSLFLSLCLCSFFFSLSATFHFRNALCDVKALQMYPGKQINLCEPHTITHALVSEMCVLTQNAIQFLRFIPPSRWNIIQWPRKYALLNEMTLFWSEFVWYYTCSKVVTLQHL